MPFTPIRLLLLFDNQRGYCEKVIPRMREMLERRAFSVDVHAIQDGEIDIEEFKARGATTRRDARGRGAARARARNGPRCAPSPPPPPVSRAPPRARAVAVA